MGTRTHIILPDDLLKEVDTIAGKRKRSEFIEEAIRTQLRLEKQRRAAAMMRMEGSDTPAWYMPGLEDYDDVSDFIHDQRQKDGEHRQRKMNWSDEHGALSS